jgi:hypothetical protein
MPFTPLHFGPGAALKAALPGRLSFLSFAITQVVVDTETLVHLLRNERPIHGPFHTLAGATGIGIAVGVILYWICRPAARWAFGRSPSRFEGLEMVRSEVTFAGALLGGILGGSSHSLLDALMYTDVRPFQPFLDANPFYRAIPASAVVLGCVIAGGAGFAALAYELRSWRRERTRP